MPIGSRALRVSEEAHAKALRLAAHVARYGWASIEIDRGDPPTITAMVEAGLDALELRRSAKRRQNPRR